MPFFSIIIPTYNRAHFLPETINSFIKQDFRDFEIIIVDDGSIDNTQQLIKKHFNNNPTIIYIWQRNAERGVARNKGIEKASGLYIVFFDSDDIMKPHHLQVLYYTIKQYPHVNFFATKYEFFRNTPPSQLLPQTTPKRREKFYKCKVGDFPPTMKHLPLGFYGIDFILKGNPFACHFCIKKNNPSLYLFHPDRKYAIMEDWMFLVQNLINDKIYVIDKTTVLIRDHAGRSMRSDNQLIIQKRLLATDWIIENLQLVPIQISTLKGYSFYFCAIHSYLDNDLKNGLKFWWKAVNEIGLRKELLMLLPKILIGKKLIEVLKNDRNQDKRN